MIDAQDVRYLSDRVKSRVLEFCRIAASAVRTDDAPTDTLTELTERTAKLLGEQPIRLICERYYPMFSYESTIDWQYGAVRSEYVVEHCGDGDPYPHGIFRGFISRREIDMSGDETSADDACIVLHMPDADRLFIVLADAVTAVQTSQY